AVVAMNRPTSVWWVNGWRNCVVCPWRTSGALQRPMPRGFLISRLNQHHRITPADDGDIPPNPMTIELSIVIVNWNVRDLLRDCLRSIDAGRGPLRVEVIVVDSASADGSGEMVREEFPWVKLVACAENVGFPRGNNIGLAKAVGECLSLIN